MDKNERHYGMPRVVTREKILEALDHYKSPTREEIAFYLSVTPQIVGLRAREYGIELRRQFPREKIIRIRLETIS